MGEVIRPSATADRIEQCVRDTVRNANAQPETIRAIVQQTMDAPFVRIDQARKQWDADAMFLDGAWGVTLACDRPADQQIKAIRDELWNALGRPRQSPVMDTVFPGGVATYTDADPHEQPLRMAVLEKRLQDASHGLLNAAQKQSWIDRLAAVREPYLRSLEPLRTAEAHECVSNAGYRDACRAGAVALTRLKRNLKNEGLTETQIHEIIPDVGAGPKPGSAGPAPAA